MKGERGVEEKAQDFTSLYKTWAKIDEHTDNGKLESSAG
jgi:hypothetical protein